MVMMIVMMMTMVMMIMVMMMMMIVMSIQHWNVSDTPRPDIILEREFNSTVRYSYISKKPNTGTIH